MTRWTEHDYAIYRKDQEAKAKRSKYGNRRTERNGITFDSKREADRYTELQLMETAGAISNLRRQVPFAIVVNRMHVCDYVADFVYVENGKEIVEDSKGHRTEVYRLKRKLMRACCGIEIREA